MDSQSIPGLTIEDEILRNYIDVVFDKYDKDLSGGLDKLEMAYFFNDLFAELNIKTIVSPEQANEAIHSIDQNGDGVIDKKELFDAFKFMMHMPQSPVYKNPQNCCQCDCQCSKKGTHGRNPYDRSRKKSGQQETEWGRRSL